MINFLMLSLVKSSVYPLANFLLSQLDLFYLEVSMDVTLTTEYFNTCSLTTYCGHILVESLSGEAGCMPDNRRKVGRAPELQLG